jgi:exonuclease VII large subunit
VAPDIAELSGAITQLHESLDAAMARQVADMRSDLDGLLQRLAQQSPAARVGRDRQALDDLLRRAGAQLRHGIDLRRARLVGAGAQLAALNPLATLGRALRQGRNRLDAFQGHEDLRGQSAR